MTTVTAEDAVLAFADEGPVTQFHAFYMRIAGRLEHTVPDHVRTAIRGGRLLPWPEYLIPADLSGQVTRVMRGRYQLAVASTVRLRRPTSTRGAERAYRPVVETQDSALQARTVEEFMELLRLVAVNSGSNRNQLARRSGLPTSTTYHLLSPANTVLPTKPDQIVALTQACGLGSPQVDRVMRLWAELRQGKAALDSAVDASAPAEVESSTGGSTPANGRESLPTALDRRAEVRSSRRSRPSSRSWRMNRTVNWLRLALAAIVISSVSGWVFSQSTTDSENSSGITTEPLSTAMLLMMTLTTTVVTVYGKVRDLRLERRHRRSPT
ncbi:hypothetical protein [Saccharothrix sp. HUAS TT1]|uniref:hypothetical protein n=1 Tax=unclassified Saccharothrix TaxID=2593673 RepID=UPI00345BC15C